MLTRSTQCGEFYIMSPPTTMAGANGDGWRPHMCDMIIYDEEADKHVRISWEEALAATMVDKDGKVGGVGNAANMAGVQGKTTADWVDLAFHWAQWNSAPAATALKKVSDGTASAVTTDTDKKTQHAVLSQLDIPYIIVCRPFSAPPRPAPLSVSKRLARVRARSHVHASSHATAAVEHLMHSAILTVSGRDTGATLFGPADMQLSANTQVKSAPNRHSNPGRATIVLTRAR